MTNIWDNEGKADANQGKQDVGFMTWRVLAMDRIVELTGKDQDDAVARLQGCGLLYLGSSYENGDTAETLAQRLSK